MVPRLRPPGAFVVVGLTVATFLAASSAPSPLYPAYEDTFDLTASSVTLVFAVYVLALLATLLVAGRVSDHVGRRPVLATALLVEAGSLVAFLLADGVLVLTLARVVQGVATGIAMGVMGAYLLDLQRYGTEHGALVNSVAPVAGLAVGGVLAGTLAEYAPAPLRLVYLVLLAAVLLLLLAVATLPETAARRPGALAAMRPVVAVPRRARPAFVGAVPVFASTWALGGLMLSVSGSVLASQLGVTNHALSGLVIAAFTGAGALASLLGRGLSSPTLTRSGLGALVAGLGAFVAALVLSSLDVLVLAVTVAGVGFGIAFLGALRSLTALAEPHERSALMSAVYMVSYVAFAVPALVAGALVGEVGLHATALGYAAVVGTVAATALVVDLVRARRAPDGPPEPAVSALGCPGVGR
ncbi:MFS transporter [Phycicoccus endophyticus]|uniref:MFS transporter n=1 Tax=Phycicoccus endophyticus TaxID=1690220 RepID=A0A7G9R4G3_9MICO|nr:MFS transporter [Phycicoccus endophyticus]NHI18371.1 MFS transporter [Phycicoccus endophyticus]QNN50488.1 MFS transporter [Phycicoccus endophyticus]GGL24321.1 MFS transporter [Phycicoccus endophyticus]